MFNGGGGARGLGFNFLVVDFNITYEFRDQPDDLFVGADHFSTCVADGRER